MIRNSVCRMQGYVPGEQPGPGVVKLNTNENPYPPSPAVLEALQNAGREALRRYPDPMAVKVRQEIARLHGCHIDQVFAGNGSDEVLALCTRAFVEDGGKIGYFDPSYSLYPVLAAIRDVEVAPVRLGPAFEWKPPPGGECDLFFLTNPNAPTSLLFPREAVEKYCDTALGVVVIDEAYVDFAEQHCMDLALSRSNVLVCRTLSKSYSLAGARVGYAVGHSDLIAAMYKIKDSYNMDAVSQMLAIAALRDVDWMRANRDRIVATRERLKQWLRKQQFEVADSATNFLWVRPAGITSAELFQELRSQNILVRYFPGELTGAYLRITVGTDEDTDLLMKAIDAIVNP